MPILYRLDVRTKLFCVMVLTLLVFFIDKLPAAVFLLAAFIVFRLMARRQVTRSLFAGLKTLTLLAAFIILLQMMFAPGANYIIKPLIPLSFPVFGGALSLKWEGLILGIVIVCRLAVLMLFLPVFTETTPPHKISAGLCALGINYRLSFIITAAFNLIFVFKEEALHIIDAQKLRGMKSFEKPNAFFFLPGIRGYISLLVPLMLCAMRKAQISSVAMDSRAFGIYKTRTWLEKPQMKALDFWFILACCIFSAGVLIFNYL